MSLLSGLVACYDLQEPSGSRYSRNGLNTLTDNNTVLQGIGKVGAYSADFESSNSEYLSVTSTDFNFSTAMSAAVWLNPESISSEMFILGKTLFSTDAAYSMDTEAATNSIFFRVASASNDFGNYGAYASALTVGTWSHWVVVYDGGQVDNASRLKFYKDGLQVTLTFSGTIPATARTTAADFILGYFNGLGRYYDGLQNQVILWNRPLQSHEVATLNNGGNGLAYPFTDPLKTVLRGHQRRQRNAGDLINQRQP